ncbi:hypothetical protein BKA04_001939 [Cryobacterium mesophilum]|nr:hypothetical protein [Terrimesophilobacter mesophilus]
MVQKLLDRTIIRGPQCSGILRPTLLPRKIRTLEVDTWNSWKTIAAAHRFDGLKRPHQTVDRRRSECRKQRGHSCLQIGGERFTIRLGGPLIEATAAGTVRMDIDQTRGQEPSAQVAPDHARGKLGDRHDSFDTSISHQDGMIYQHRVIHNDVGSYKRLAYFSH